MWNLPEQPFSSVAAIAEDIERHGYHCWENAIPPDALKSLQSSVSAANERQKGNYFAFHGKDQIGENLLSRLSEQKALRKLLADLYYYSTKTIARSDEIAAVLRCVQGKGGLRESNRYHFDASLVTMLMPLLIPTEGEKNGDLIMFPNIRSPRGNVWVNILEKAAIQNNIARNLITSLITSGFLKPLALKLKPGNLYFFWGYRSLHANEPCDPDAQRATALFHFGDPHQDSFATRLVAKMNRRRAELASRPDPAGS